MYFIGMRDKDQSTPEAITAAYIAHSWAKVQKSVVRVYAEGKRVPMCSSVKETALALLSATYDQDQIKIEEVATHIENTEAALEFWATVPPEAVLHELEGFREGGRRSDAPSCGSPACFGEWLRYSPHFAALGVYYIDSGVPRFARYENASSYAVSDELFGHDWMFTARRYGEEGTAHEVVTTRLKSILAKLA